MRSLRLRRTNSKELLSKHRASLVRRLVNHLPGTRNRFATFVSSSSQSRVHKASRRLRRSFLVFAETSPDASKPVGTWMKVKRHLRTSMFMRPCRRVALEPPDSFMLTFSEASDHLGFFISTNWAQTGTFTFFLASHSPKPNF
jgi:hypothetical protein